MENGFFRLLIIYVYFNPSVQSLQCHQTGTNTSSPPFCTGDICATTFTSGKQEVKSCISKVTIADGCFGNLSFVTVCTCKQDRCNSDTHNITSIIPLRNLYYANISCVRLEKPIYKTSESCDSAACMNTNDISRDLCDSFHQPKMFYDIYPNSIFVIQSTKAEFDTSSNLDLVPTKSYATFCTVKKCLEQYNYESNYKFEKEVTVCYTYSDDNYNESDICNGQLCYTNNFNGTTTRGCFDYIYDILWEHGQGQPFTDLISNRKFQDITFYQFILLEFYFCNYDYCNRDHVNTKARIRLNYGASTGLPIPTRAAKTTKTTTLAPTSTTTAPSTTTALLTTPPPAGDPMFPVDDPWWWTCFIQLGRGFCVSLKRQPVALTATRYTIMCISVAITAVSAHAVVNSRSVTRAYSTMLLLSLVTWMSVDLVVQFLGDPIFFFAVTCVYRRTPQTYWQVSPATGMAIVQSIVMFGIVMYIALFIYRHQIIAPDGSRLKFSLRVRVAFLTFLLVPYLGIGPLFYMECAPIGNTFRSEETDLFDARGQARIDFYSVDTFYYALLIFDGLFAWIIIARHTFALIKGARNISPTVQRMHRILTRSLIFQALTPFVFIIIPISTASILQYFFTRPVNTRLRKWPVLPVDIALVLFACHATVHSAVLIGTTPAFREQLLQKLSCLRPHRISPEEEAPAFDGAFSSVPPSN